LQTGQAATLTAHPDHLSVRALEQPLDITRFDALLRSISLAGTRRRALVVLLGGLTATFAVAETEAGKKGKKKRRRQRRRRLNELPPFCTGKNTCGDFSSTCQRSGTQCNCLINATTGESSCLDTPSSRFAATCDDCTPDETCVDLRRGTGPCTGTSFFCYKPCPNPLYKWTRSR
jgi:hypothetical protein